MQLHRTTAWTDLSLKHLNPRPRKHVNAIINKLSFTAESVSDVYQVSGFHAWWYEVLLDFISTLLVDSLIHLLNSQL